MVSIIINNYNYGRYLKQAIDSALGQTYGELEVIVVDDGSTDNSQEIINSYADRVIPVFKENGGQASTFNAGLVCSRGDVVIFLDSDDMLLPETAQRVVEIFGAQPDVVKVMYCMEVIDALGRRTGAIKPANHLPMRSGNLREHVLRFPFDMTWMATSGNAFTAQVLRQIFPIPEQAYGHVGADWYLSLVTPLFGQVVFLEYVGAWYRVHGTNNYEVTGIDLAQIRHTIDYMMTTHAYITYFADRLGLRGRLGEASDLLSVSYIANRFISLKLDPRQHPIKTDTAWRLFLLGAAASFQRFDVSLPMKCLYLLWFMAMLLAPIRMARWLAVKFSLPSARKQFNKILRGFHSIQ